MGPRGGPSASPKWRSEGDPCAGLEDWTHVRHTQAAGSQSGHEVGTDPSLVRCPGVTAFSGPAGPTSPEVTVPQLSPDQTPGTGSLNVAPPRAGEDV